jgi:hypothetical protein
MRPGMAAVRLLVDRHALRDPSAALASHLSAKPTCCLRLLSS